MEIGRFCTVSSRRRRNHADMDIVSVALAVVMFAALFGLILAIDKI
jgi:hypothetical protein